MTKTLPIVLLSVVLAGLALSSAFAGGHWLYEEATPDMGVGGAGRQASMPRHLLDFRITRPKVQDFPIFR